MASNTNKLEKINNRIIKQQQITESNKKSYKVLLLAIICFLFAFILYSNTFKHSYVLDDRGIIYGNWIVTKGVQGIPIILKSTYWHGANVELSTYRPFSQIMFAIEWQISPNNPFLSHFLNVLFYALSCLLLFIVLHKYMSKAHATIPLVITLLYSAHPIHTEVVANIKSRDEIMSFFFLMFTLLFLHTWFTKRKWWCLIVSLLMFFLAFLSKEGVITMIFLFPIIGWYFTDSKPKTILTGSLLLIIPAITYIIIRHQILLKNSVPFTILIIENFLIGAPDAITHFATAVMLLGKYLLLSVIPYQLVCDYSYNQIPFVGLLDLKFILSLLIYTAIIIYVILNIRKKNPVIFGLLFFLITISIYSNILFNIVASFGERLMFLPSLGFCIAFVFFLTQWLKVGITNKIRPVIEVLKSKPIFTTICIIILLVFSVKTVIRAAKWKNEITLFGNDIKYSPNSAQLCLWWGGALFVQAEKEENKLKKDAIMLQAKDQFEKGLSIYPYAEYYSQLCLVWLELGNKKKAVFYANNALKQDTPNAIKWYNIGLFYDRTGDFQKAIEFYKKAISLNPSYSDAYLNLGCSLNDTHKYNEAIVKLTKAIELIPNRSDAYYDRGFARYNIQDYTGAIADYNMAITIDPNIPEIYNHLGLAKYGLQEYTEAIADYNMAVKINPKFDLAYNNRGSAKYKLKDYTGAIADYTKAIEIKPDYYDAYNNRGFPKYDIKDYAGAIADYNMAVKINPNFSEAYLNIGRILGESQKYEESIIYFKKCIQLDSENVKAYNNIALSYQNLKQPEEANLWFEKARILQQKNNK